MMQLTHALDDALQTRSSRNPLSVPFLGILISGLLIFCGLVFRTYYVSLQSVPWELARQLGLPFVGAEMIVIYLALRRGMNIDEIWRGLPPVPRHSLTVFLALFWIGAAFFSEMGAFAMTQNLIMLVHLLFGAALYHLLTPIDRSGTRGMAKWLAVGLSIFCVMTAFAFIYHPPLSSMPDNQIVWQFAIPGFISVRLFGAFCGALFCFILAQLLQDEEHDENTVYQYLWLTLAAAMMIWSGTRAAVVGSFAAIAIFGFVHQLRPKKISTAFAIAGSIGVATIFAVSLVPYGDGTFLVVAPADTAQLENVSGGRLSYWTAVWEAYRTVPYFGAGPFAPFWILPEGQATHVQPHNIILQFLISWGVFATVAALLAIAYATWCAHRIAMQNRVVLPFLAMLDCLLVMSFFDGMAHFAQHLMLIMVAYGAIFSVDREKVIALPSSNR